MRRAIVDENGVFLSPFEQRNWLEAYRGVRLPFGGNRDQVVAFVESKVQVSSGDGGEPGSGRRAQERRKASAPNAGRCGAPGPSGGSYRPPPDDRAGDILSRERE